MLPVKDALLNRASNRRARLTESGLLAGRTLAAVIWDRSRVLEPGMGKRAILTQRHRGAYRTAPLVTYTAALERGCAMRTEDGLKIVYWQPWQGNAMLYG